MRLSLSRSLSLSLARARVHSLSLARSLSLSHSRSLARSCSRSLALPLSRSPALPLSRSPALWWGALADSGAAVNAGSTQQLTALHWAVRNDHAACVALLLDRGANASLPANVLILLALIVHKYTC